MTASADGLLDMSDEEEIRKLIVISAEAWDSYHDEDWLACVTDDHVFRVGDIHCEGLRALSELTDSMRSSSGRGTHILSVPLIILDGISASAVTRYAYVELADDGEYRMSAVGRYDDEFVKEAEGRWKCASRVNTHHNSG